MVNNFKQIRELLEFRSKDDMYFCQILQRKKDAKEGQKVNGTNNISRLVKAYYIKSLDQFDFIENEVIKLCELFNARAGINLNRRSFEKMALQHLKKVTDQLINKDYSKAYKAYSSVTGAYSHDSDKKWIIDLDGEAENTFDFVANINNFLKTLEPNVGESKVITRIPSKSGSHLITSPFNLKDFKDKYPTISVHKNNPTNIYCP
jgi:hypothetical protein